MLRLNLYLWRNLSGALVMGIGIASFLMVVAGVAAEDKLLGVVTNSGMGPVLSFIGLQLPEVLGFTIPLSVLAATVLVINRMSGDNEIVALRANGIGMLQLLSPLVLFAVALSIFCACLQFFMIPNCKHEGRALLQTEGVMNPLLFLEPGHFVEMFPGYVIYVGERQDNRVEDVHIYVLREGAVRQYVIAGSGTVSLDEADKRLWLELRNATITNVDPENPNDPEAFQRLHSEEAVFPLDYGSAAMGRKSLVRKDSEMTLPQLFARTAIYAEQGIPTTGLLVEIHNRAAISLAPLSFLLIGLAFGIRSGRRDTSTGLVACLVVAMGYYGGTIGAQSLDSSPNLHPELLTWIPNVVCQGIGLVGIWKKR